MSDFNVRTTNLRAINSMTKYPSIPTYHALDPKNGTLLEEPVVFPGEAVATEKVDGTNARIILLPDGTYLLGSREELLYAQGDLIGNPSQGIVEQLKPVADALPVGDGDTTIRVVFLELYGGKVGAAARQYAKQADRYGWRLFDVALIGDVEERLSWSPQQIAAWRDGGGQTFADEDQLHEVEDHSGLELAPRLFEGYGDSLPASIQDMRELLAKELPATRVSLDGSGGRAEGIVFRSPDRSVIAKARFQDYDRTLKRRRQA